MQQNRSFCISNKIHNLLTFHSGKKCLPGNTVYCTTMFFSCRVPPPLRIRKSSTPPSLLQWNVSTLLDCAAWLEKTNHLQPEMIEQEACPKIMIIMFMQVILANVTLYVLMYLLQVDSPSSLPEQPTPAPTCSCAWCTSWWGWPSPPPSSSWCAGSMRSRGRRCRSSGRRYR